MAREQDQLLIEAHQINYRLRSTLFYRKIKEYNVLAFLSQVANLFPTQELYSWDERANWGIGEDAFKYISSHEELKPIQVFCHPRLLREYPSLLYYYRHIAALPQKSISYLVQIDVKKYEEKQDNIVSIPTQDVFTLARLFNEHITLIIDSSIENFTGEELNALLLTSTGTQIDGAWRNAIGNEAERVVQRLLVKEAVKRDLLVAFMHRIGTGMDRYDQENFEGQLSDIGKYRGILLNNQTSILFSSEPVFNLTEVIKEKERYDEFVNLVFSVLGEVSN